MTSMWVTTTRFIWILVVTTNVNTRNIYCWSNSRTLPFKKHSSDLDLSFKQRYSYFLGSINSFTLCWLMISPFIRLWKDDIFVTINFVYHEIFVYRLSDVAPLMDLWMRCLMHCLTRKITMKGELRCAIKTKAPESFKFHLHTCNVAILLTFFMI